jgi:thioredoxin reductase
VVGSAAEGRFEVAIVGGGPAGLTAALVLGRMRRRVALLDGDDPAHAPSEAVHGFLGHDGAPPADLRRIGREQLSPYTSVDTRMAEVGGASVADAGFSLHVGGEAIEAEFLLLAAGMRYRPPAIDGIERVWARGAYHCPYCHGWEVRDLPLAAYGADEMGVHLALLLTSLSGDVALLTDGDDGLTPEQVTELLDAGIAIREQPIARLESDGDRLAQVKFADGATEERAGLFFAPAFEPSPLIAELGCETDDSGAIAIDPEGRTSVPALFAAGDATTEKKAVVLAAAAGSRAAYAINAELAHRPGAVRIR